jgi:hypothetical protein
MVAVEQKARVEITEHGVASPAGIFGYDTPKALEEHVRYFQEIGGAIVAQDGGALALQCGVASGLVVIEIGKSRGSFVPKLDPGKYGVEHANLGYLLRITKRVVDVAKGQVHAIFGIVPGQWLDGLNSCTLVQPDLEGRGAINLLADGCYQPIEPTPGFRFYTPFQHIPRAGSGFEPKKSRPEFTTYPLYRRLGIMTLSRTQLSELLRAFNSDWSNGPVFARRHKVGEAFTDSDEPKRKTRRRKKKEGLDKWS